MSNPAVIKHGAFSKVVRRRYSDRRTTEGKQLARIMQEITEDLGGEAALTASQRLILSAMKSKLQVILQISRYADRQLDLIDKDGQLIPVLRSTLTHYQSELRRDVELLNGMSRKDKRQPGYRAALKALAAGGGDDD